MRWFLLCLLIALSSLFGCAQGESDPVDAGNSDGDTNGDVDPGDATEDSDTSDARDTEDTDQPQDLCAVCCPGEVTCVDGTTRGVCKDDGSGYEETECGAGDICTSGTCEPEPVCTEGETRCFDSTTRLVCRPGGEAFRQETCATGESCFDGECVTGEPNGSACTSADDCAGDKCHCGSAESCSPTPTAAFCTAECTPGSCGPDEICVDSDIVDGSSYDHCVPTCTDICPISGLSCVALPTNDSGALDWVQGCHLDTVDRIGAKNCSSADTCAGDTCLEGYFDFSMCTHACDEECPEGTACAVLPDGDGNAYCTPLCGDGSRDTTENCLLAPDGDIFVADCEYHGGSTVCVK